MALGYNDTLRNALLGNMKTYVDGNLLIYSGTRPLAPDYPHTDGVLLATFNINFDAPVQGVMSLAGAPLAAQVAATGTASWFRLIDGNYKVDGNITSVADGTGDALLDNVNLVEGEMVSLKTMNFSIANPS